MTSRTERTPEAGEATSKHGATRGISLGRGRRHIGESAYAPRPSHRPVAMPQASRTVMGPARRSRQRHGGGGPSQQRCGTWWAFGTKTTASEAHPRPRRFAFLSPMRPRKEGRPIAFKEDPIFQRTRASKVTVIKADGSRETRDAYNGGQLRTVIAGGVPRERQDQTTAVERALTGCCGKPTVAQLRRVRALKATHADISQAAASYRRRWPNRRLTVHNLLEAWSVVGADNGGGS